MSVPVEPEKLADAVEQYGPTTYLITTDDDGRPRVNQVEVSISGHRVAATVGRSASANISERPHVVLLWPPIADDGFTLLADGEGRVDGEPGPDSSIRIAITSAVQHRRSPG